MSDIFQLIKQLLSYERVNYKEISVKERLFLLKAMYVRLQKIHDAINHKIAVYEQVLKEKEEKECPE